MRVDKRIYLLLALSDIILAILLPPSWLWTSATLSLIIGGIVYLNRNVRTLFSAINLFQTIQVDFSALAFFGLLFMAIVFRPTPTRGFFGELSLFASHVLCASIYAAYRAKTHFTNIWRVLYVRISFFSFL